MVSTHQASTYLSGISVQINRATSADLQAVVLDEQNRQMRRDMAGMAQRAAARQEQAPAGLSTAAVEKPDREAGKSLNPLAPVEMPAPQAGREADRPPARQPGAPSRRSGRGVER